MEDEGLLERPWTRALVYGSTYCLSATTSTAIVENEDFDIVAMPDRQCGICWYFTQASIRSGEVVSIRLNGRDFCLNN